MTRGMATSETKTLPEAGGSRQGAGLDAGDPKAGDSNAGDRDGADLDMAAGAPRAEAPSGAAGSDPAHAADPAPARRSTPSGPDSGELAPQHDLVPGTAGQRRGALAGADRGAPHPAPHKPLTRKPVVHRPVLHTSQPHRPGAPRPKAAPAPSPAGAGAPVASPPLAAAPDGAVEGGPCDVLIVVHQAHSTPGRIGERLERRGYRLDVRRPALGDPLPESLDGHRAVVVFGGPMSANDELPFIRAEIAFMEAALKAGVPLLGICLGAQMMARALGARVSPHGEGECEIGYYPLRPTELGSSMLAWPSHVYHWHSEGFDLPAGADLLATGATFPNQAFRYGDSAYGLQFHPEVTREMMCRWTTKGAHHLTRRGAQPGDAHLEGWGRYDSAVCRWLDGFLDTWLGKAARAPGQGGAGKVEPPVPGLVPRLVTGE